MVWMDSASVLKALLSVDKYCFFGLLNYDISFLIFGIRMLFYSTFIYGNFGFEPLETKLYWPMRLDALPVLTANC